MAISINRVMIAGNLTRDPETRFLANDKAVASFSLACNRRYRTGDGEQKEEVTFIDVEAWGRTAELVGQYCTKGKPVFVEGRLKLDSWSDQQGNKRSRLKVVADSVHFLPGGGSRDAQPDATSVAPAMDPTKDAPKSEPASFLPPEDEDSPPF